MAWIEYSTEVIPGEEWRLIDWVTGYENLHAVSDHGRVRRAAEGRGTFIGRILKPRASGHKNKSFYLVVSFNNNTGKTKHCRIHLLVARAFLGPCPPGHEVNHIHGNPLTDNRLSNLEYLTPEANRQHAIDTGLMPTGARLPQTRIPDSEIPIIRQLLADGMKQAAVARIYHCGQDHISRIKTGLRRKRV